MPAAFSNVRDLAADGDWLWAVTQNVRYRPSGLYGYHLRRGFPPMDKGEPLNGQDWYRVRRGEDEIAWGKTHHAPGLDDIVFSRRSFQEFAFLTKEQQTAVRRCLTQMKASSPS
jgi:hypothetical protein